MEIKELRCPYCGASLHIEKEGYAECEYCHRSFYAKIEKPEITKNYIVNNYNKSTSEEDTKAGQKRHKKKTRAIWISIIIIAASILIAAIAVYKTAARKDDTKVATTKAATTISDEESKIQSDIDKVTELSYDNMTDDDIEDILSSIGLEKLSILSASGVSDYTFLRSIPNMTTLEIHDASNLQDASFIKTMPRLKKLTLDETSITDLDILSGNISIIDLELIGNPIDDYGFIATLKSLKHLKIDKDASLPDLSDLAYLEEVEYVERR